VVAELGPLVVRSFQHGDLAICCCLALEKAVQRLEMTADQLWPPTRASSRPAGAEHQLRSSRPIFLRSSDWPATSTQADELIRMGHPCGRERACRRWLHRADLLALNRPGETEWRDQTARRPPCQRRRWQKLKGSAQPQPLDSPPPDQTRKRSLPEHAQQSGRFVEGRQRWQSVWHRSTHAWRW
jgi:hypothetical protein